MSAEKNRSSQLAVVQESTSGTIVAPSAGTEYIALQEGFSFEANFQQLENAEIKASIGVAKSIQGLEEPKGSFDHYVRHSGVEGQAPGFGPLLESALGAVSTNGTERLTTTGSTVSVVKLASGGSDFARGKAVLIKDGTNGYSIRPVHSVSSNDLTLGFDLENSPASGIGCGKNISYSVANTGHQPLSMWLFRGNGGAIEAISGAKVTDLSISVKSGELINASYSFEGTKYFFDPIEITSSTNKVDFTDDDGTFAATVTAGMYRDPHELAQAIEDAMNTANTGETKTVSYLDASGKFKITSTGTVLSLLWNSGANTANSIAAKIGFSTGADSTGTAAGTGYTSPTALSWAAPHTPSFDSADPLAAKNHEILLGDHDNIVCFCADSLDITLKNELVNEQCICAESGVQDKIHNKREVEAKISGTLQRHDADKFKKFRNADDVRFAYNFGVKSGGNWVPGKCGNIYFPSATVSSYVIGDNNGLITMEITVKGYVDATGAGEFFINFL